MVVRVVVDSGTLDQSLCRMLLLQNILGASTRGRDGQVWFVGVLGPSGNGRKGTVTKDPPNAGLRFYLGAAFAFGTF